jgi:hypothetical protein
MPKLRPPNINLLKKFSVYSKIILGFEKFIHFTYTYRYIKNLFTAPHCDFLGLAGGEPEKPFSHIFYVYSVMRWPEKVFICCGGQAKKKWAKNSSVTTSTILHRKNLLLPGQSMILL